MKLNTILTANEPLKRLCEKRLASYKKMRELVKLRRAMDEEVDFYLVEEQKAINTYAVLDSNGSPAFLEDGRLRLKDATAKVAFEEEIEALRATEIDTLVPITLCESDFASPADLPTTNDMLALEGIIIFDD